LHRAFYERKPRGGPTTLPEAYSVRLSLCCGRMGCRRRSLPPSCLFMGRRVYWGPVVLVVVTLRQQRSVGASANKLRRLFGISHKTLVRWMRYFREVFPRTVQWQRLRGLVSAEVFNAELPSALLMYVIGTQKDEQQALIACLCFLAAGGVSLWGSPRMRDCPLHAKDGGFPGVMEPDR
jgi:hypothetical protein